jgi:hypothetical protein
MKHTCKRSTRRAFATGFILIVYGQIDLFVLGLQDELDREGADTLIARTPADAMQHLQRFDFDAAVINHVQGLDAGTRELVADLAGTPLLVLCNAVTPVSLLRFPCLVKPVCADAVVEVLVRLVGH